MISKHHIVSKNIKTYNNLNEDIKISYSTKNSWKYNNLKEEIAFFRNVASFVSFDFAFPSLALTVGFGHFP